jgi:hypothetical protein
MKNQKEKALVSSVVYSDVKAHYTNNFCANLSLRPPSNVLLLWRMFRKLKVEGQHSNHGNTFKWFLSLLILAGSLLIGVFVHDNSNKVVIDCASVSES